ncbi:Crp/Fnr family transcriptional regulator [Micromonospora sp. NPDC053740]|uniref:Crp/Fnr family transcriptional regulator n=1 Tax=Micromonospora TaxID=1873 RepID=UPI001EE8ABD4|nr:Crp/Fnr family transcriptional regulator [Micromonospora alfalfae]MCG5467025.1 Crp/Fnr family transcriptional regulator [Micromonospora alfalfae]
MAWTAGSFLDRLDAAPRQELLGLGTTRTIPANSRIFTEGGQDDHVELIQRGFVKVTTTVSGLEQLLAVRLPGDLVGELAAVTGSDRSATVTACGEVVSTVVTRAVFLAFLQRRPAVAHEVTAAVGRRLRWANTRRADFTAYPVDVRLARVLAELAVTCGTDNGDGILIGVPMSQPELATLIGAAEDTVQRALRTLRSAGLLRTGYKRVTVTDVDGLRAYDNEDHQQ